MDTRDFLNRFLSLADADLLRDILEGRNAAYPDSILLDVRDVSGAERQYRLSNTREKRDIACYHVILERINGYPPYEAPDIKKAEAGCVSGRFLGLAEYDWLRRTVGCDGTEPEPENIVFGGHEHRISKEDAELFRIWEGAT